MMTDTVPAQINNHYSLLPPKGDIDIKLTNITHRRPLMELTSNKQSVLIGTNGDINKPTKQILHTAALYRSYKHQINKQFL